MVGLRRVLRSKLDLLIAGLLVDPRFVKLLSVTRLIPAAVSKLVKAVSKLFSPRRAGFFTHNRGRLLLRRLGSNVQVYNFFIGVVFIILLVVNRSFVHV